MKTTKDTKSPFATRAVQLASSGIRFNLNGISLAGGIMETIDLIEKIEARHGQISTLTMIDSLDNKMKKKGNPFFGRGFLKISTFQVRCGVSYENKATTKEKREEGIEAEPPKGKVWIDFPYWMISEKTGRVLLACSSVKNNNSKTIYVDRNFNGIEAENVKPFLKARSPFAPEWYTVELSKILRVV